MALTGPQFPAASLQQAEVEYLPNTPSARAFTDLCEGKTSAQEPKPFPRNAACNFPFHPMGFK